MSEARGVENVPAPMLVCLALTLGLALAMSFWGQACADGLLRLASLLCRPLVLVSPGHERLMHLLQGIEPGTRDLAFAWEALNLAARWYALGLGIPAALYLVWRGWRLSPSDVYRRTLTMRDLMRENVPFAPCIAPALNWPGGILNEPLDSGPWRAGRQPLQLAAECGLLVPPGPHPVPIAAEELLGSDHLARLDSPWLGREADGLALDRERAARFYASQLDLPWQGWERLPAHLRKLCGAWALFAVDDKDLARRLMDDLSLSFRGPEEARPGRFVRHAPFWEPAAPAHGCGIDASLTRGQIRAVSRALADPSLRKDLRPHSLWRDTFLLALYERARTRGVLATPEFLWLRPVDRQLYYLCNNVGRRTAWPEIAGVWAHYQAETALAALDPGSR
ncbi:MAG: hypothetical protein Q4F72_12390, partial [Desulfovibrionaceae bacterium]|nr:hypothetical protein [Desulfovibrionaceae bacterium]